MAYPARIMMSKFRLYGLHFTMLENSVQVKGIIGLNIYLQEVHSLSFTLKTD